MQRETNRRPSGDCARSSASAALVSASVAVTRAADGSPASHSTLPGLTPNTTYFWRARLVTTGNGMFTTAIQSFTTKTVPNVALTVATTGRGLGKVTSSPIGIDCGTYSSNACSINVPQGTMVSLYPAPSTPAYVFTGWSGACTGTGVCNVPMNAASSVTATFDFFDTRTAVPLPPGPYPRRL